MRAQRLRAARMRSSPQRRARRARRRFVAPLRVPHPALPGCSMSSQTAAARACVSSNGTRRPAPDASMSSAYQYGVETAAQPAASANVKRTRRDLLPVAIRRDEDVRRGEQVGQLVDREEAVVELDVVAEIEIDDTSLEHEPVLLALATRDLRMGSPGDQIHDFRVPLDDRRQAPRSPSRDPCPVRSARTWRAGTGTAFARSRRASA